MSVSSFEEITRDHPEKSLTVHLKKHSGRNNTGKITVRHRGGGHKTKYRLIDFKRDKLDVPGKVAHIEYDPNRSARIALIHYNDGEKRYILCPVGLRQGDKVMVERTVPETQRIVVAGVQLAKRHTRANQQGNFQGGIVDFHAPFSYSNVQLVCPSCDKRTRIRHEIDDKGSKHLTCLKCQKRIERVAPACGWVNWSPSTAWATAFL